MKVARSSALEGPEVESRIATGETENGIGYVRVLRAVPEDKAA